MWFLLLDWKIDQICKWNNGEEKEKQWKKIWEEKINGKLNKIRYENFF